MELELVYDSKEAIPSEYAALYTERDGKFHFSAIRNMKTQADIDRLQVSLDKERGDHKATKDKYRAFNNMDVTEVLAKLDKYDELEAAAADKLDDAKIQELADKRAQAKIAPLQRQITDLEATNTELKTQNEGFQANERKRTIHDAVRKVATDTKVVGSAMDDVLMYAERDFQIGDDGKVLTKDGLPVDLWLKDRQKDRPHWWPPSAGGGAGGGGGTGGKFTDNPWSAKSWNMTNQGKVLREEGRERAEQLAKAAGSVVGAARPPEA